MKANVMFDDRMITMDAQGTIAPNQTNKDKDKLHVRVEAVLTKNFPYKNNTPIPITLVCGPENYSTAHIRATAKVPYPCWISNPPLKRHQENLGEFLARNGFKNRDKVILSVRRSAPALVVEIAKSGAIKEAPRQTFPDEIPDAEKIIEGAKKSVVVNTYERDPNARKACIKHWGCYCSACGLNFKERYGDLGSDFIHVHHLKPISEIGNEYELDPVNDLRPVCPNCHAMIHRAYPILSIEELKSVLNENAK